MTEKLRLACAAIAAAPQAKAIKQSGIYVIVHVETLRQYTGTTMNFRQRMWYHRAQLKAGKHHNRPLQRDWSEFGADAFRYGLVLPFLTAWDRSRQYALEREVIASGDAAKSYNLIGAEAARRSPSGELLKHWPIKLTADEWAWLKERGGAAWLREQMAITQTPPRHE